jgi:hypothetical protein
VTEEPMRIRILNSVCIRFLCSIGQILAIMRQWVPQIQHAINSLLLEVLKRGAHPDDRLEL